MRPYTLYWSSFELYTSCPRKFLWTRGWPTIDLGRGLGRGKEPPIRKSQHHILMGVVLSNMLEFFYNDEEYRSPDGLLDRLESKVKRSFDYHLTRLYVDWSVAPSREEMWKVVYDGMLGFIRTVKANKLLGPYSRAEVDLLGYINKWTPIGGRPDIVIRRDDTGVTILDGKNSIHKGRYTNPDQLRWYALCFYLFYGKMPDRLGFVYFRHPAEVDSEGSIVEGTGVDWVACSKEDIQDLAKRAVDVRKNMEKERFGPKPSWSACRFCEFELVCPERQQQKMLRSKTQVDFSGGFDDLSLSDTSTPKEDSIDG